MRTAIVSILTASAFAIASVAPAGAFMRPPIPMHHGWHPPMHHHWHHMPKPPKPAAKPASGHHHGGMGYVGYIPFCAATGLIISGVYVGHTQHRELTTNEALGILGTCIFPPLALFYLAQQPSTN